MVGTLTDISHRKNIEEELQKSKTEMQDKLDEARKLNELTVDRELKMVELKEKIKELESKLS
jgi:flagellar motility protein MotE (MotC chaperone)